jgi:selenide,water dikinase
MEALEGRVLYGEGISEFEFMVLADAQTSGGMLISVPEERANALVKSLVANETLYSEVVGRVGNDGQLGTVTIEK